MTTLFLLLKLVTSETKESFAILVSTLISKGDVSLNIAICVGPHQAGVRRAGFHRIATVNFVPPHT